MRRERPVITQACTILSHIWLRRTPDGHCHAEKLWQIDLQAHFAYITNVRICCPVVDCAKVGEGWRLVEGLDDTRVTRMPAVVGWRAAIVQQPAAFRAVREAVSDAALVHSSGAGWPFPPPYYVLLLWCVYRFHWFMAVAPSPWATRRTGRRSLRSRIGSLVHDRLVKYCVRSADMHRFSKGWYRHHFLGGAEASLVAPEIWVDDAQIRPRHDHGERQLFEKGPLRLLLAGRFVVEKDPETFIDALRRPDASLADTGGRPSAEATIMGDSPLPDACEARAASPRSRVRLRIARPVGYGAPFFGVIRSHHAPAMCKLISEQPRLINDALSQGRPLFAAEATGTIAAVTNSGARVLFEASKAKALAARIARHITDLAPLAEMAQRALIHVAGKTHAAMHSERAKFLDQHLSDLTQAT